MEINCVEFKLRVNNYENVLLSKQGEGENNGQLMFAPLSRKIARFENLLRARQISRSKEFKELGKLLYQCLFNGSVANAFQLSIKEMERAMEKEGEKSVRLRLQLIFEKEARELAGIPWEFLYYPGDENDEGFFLVDHPNLILSRYIPLQGERPNLSIKEDSLRFLVVSSNPKLNPEKPVISKPVIEAIEELKKSYKISSEELKNPMSRELEETIETFKPHILHFIGHGRFNWQEQRGELALLRCLQETPLNERECPSWVTDETFANYFRRFKPRLVLLQACQGGEVDFSANYAGLAPQLTRKGIPVVVAMQYPVCNGVASTFSRGFYQALARGEPVDVAVQEGRRKVVQLKSEDSYSTRDFGTPVLYMNSTDGNIMPRPRVRVKFKEEALLNSRDELEAAIVKLFNQEELLNLAFDLRIKHEQLHEEIQRETAYRDLPDQTQRETVRALINCVERNGQLKTLVQLIKEEKHDEFD